MSDGETVRADDVVEARPHYGDEPCSYDCEAEADYDVTMVRNGNEGTFPACRDCAVEHGVRPGDIVQEPTPVNVGDHVEDREDPDATILVVGTSTTLAKHYQIDATTTVAHANPDYPEDDEVVEVSYPQRTHNEIPEKSYAFPRSRLRVTASIHDTDDEGGDE